MESTSAWKSMAVWVSIFYCSAKTSEQGGDFLYHNVVVFLGFIFTDALLQRTVRKDKTAHFRVSSSQQIRKFTTFKNILSSRFASDLVRLQEL